MGAACSSPEPFSGSGDAILAPRKARVATFAVPGLNAATFEEEYQEGNVFSEKVGVVRNRITTRYDVSYKLPKAAAPCTDGQKISRVLKQLQGIEHQNVCHLKEGFDSQFAVILIYQKVEGKVLYKSVREKGLSEEKAAAMGFSLVRALAAGASADPPVMHGALVPKNILVCSSGNLVLTDLGLIDVLKPDPLQRLERGGIAYMAPEVVEPWVIKQEKLDPTAAVVAELEPGERAVKTSACDVWSLGVILFELMSGRLPFRAARAVDLGRKIVDEHLDIKKALPDISSKGQALLRSMLHKSAEKRPTLEKLLSNAWLVEPFASEVSSKPFDTKIYDNLLTVHAESSMKKMAMRLMAEKIPPKQIKDLAKAFNQADRNHDGVLTFEELRRFIKTQPDMSPLTEDLEKVWGELDGDGSGQLSLHEFVAATLDTQQVMIHEVLWKTFHGMDQNHNGTLSIKELKRVVVELEGRLGQDHVNEVMSRLEHEMDHDELSFRSFSALVQQEGGRKPMVGCCGLVVAKCASSKMQA